MYLPKTIFLALLASAAAFSQESTLLDKITTPDRVINPFDKSLTGTWIALGRRAAPPGTTIPPPAPISFTFHSDGTVTGAGAGNDSTLVGVWLKITERKFLINYLAFNYNPAREVVSIAKIRMTTQLDAEGRTLQGNQEVLVVDPDGKVLFTALGGSHTMTRFAIEKPADFDAFLAKE